MLKKNLPQNVRHKKFEKISTEEVRNIFDSINSENFQPKFKKNQRKFEKSSKKIRIKYENFSN